MEQVGIHRIRRTFTLVLSIDFDLVLLTKLHQRFSRSQIPLTPRCNHFDVRFQGVSAKFKPNLIISLTCCPVRDCISARFGCNFHKALGDQRARDRSTKQIFSLVNRVATKHRKHIISHKLFSNVINKGFSGPRLQRLLAHRRVIITVAEVRSECHDFAVELLLQPFEYCRGIKSARVGQNNLVDLSHRKAPIRKTRMVPLTGRSRDPVNQVFLTSLSCPWLAADLNEPPHAKLFRSQHDP